MFAMIIGWKLFGTYVLDSALSIAAGWLIGRKQFAPKHDVAKKS